MTRKIYAFCNIIHTSQEEYGIRNHPIVAVDDKGLPVGHWVSSNHSYGKHDIGTSINQHVDYPYEFEWIEDMTGHEILKLINGQEI